MRAAILHEHGTAPAPGEFADPADEPGCVVVEVAAAGLHHLDLHKASGTFYTGPPPLPCVVGTDGVGRLADGRRVYFDSTVSPYGSMAERALVPAGRGARHVEVGNLAGAELTLPAPLIRSISLDVRGFSVAHPPIDMRREAYLRLTEHAARGDVVVDVDRVALADVAGAWERQRRAAGGPKSVIVP